MLQELGTIAGLAPGVWTQQAFQQIAGNPAPITVALKDAFGNVLDEVRISGWNTTLSEGSLGGAFHGVALRPSGKVSVERIWGQDSNAGRDWTSEAQHSLGLESRSAGAIGTPLLTAWPQVVLSEIDSDPDYIELYNRGTAAVNLQGWFLEMSAAHGSTLSRVHPFPREFVLSPSRYLVIGDGPTPPAEMPAHTQYIDLSAIDGGIIGASWRQPVTWAAMVRSSVWIGMPSTPGWPSIPWDSSPRWMRRERRASMFQPAPCPPACSSMSSSFSSTPRAG